MSESKADSDSIVRFRKELVSGEMHSAARVVSLAAPRIPGTAGRSAIQQTWLLQSLMCLFNYPRSDLCPRRESELCKYVFDVALCGAGRNNQSGSDCSVG